MQKKTSDAASNNHIRMRLDCVSIIDGEKSERRAIHEDIEIKCFYEGSAVLLIGNETVSVREGDVVVINPYELHATIACGENEGKYHMIMIPPDYFTESDVCDLELMLMLRTGQTFLKKHYENDARIFDILMNVADEYRYKKTAYEKAIKGLLVQLLALIVRSGTSEADNSAAAKRGSMHYKLIEPALRHIRDNYACRITTDELARICGLSKHYFCHIFKAVIGQPAMAYLNDYRIKVADALLGNTEKSVAAVAEACGFESTNYFSRRYKNFYGISPGKRRSTK